MFLKSLPLEKPTFAEIRERNLLYADKTEYIYKLLKNDNKRYFLSRPPLFGKTLLLHTLNALFSGVRSHFKGLFIDQSDYQLPKRPTIFLNMSLDATSPAGLKEKILADLREIAANNHLKVKGNAPDVYFGGLIKAFYKKTATEIEPNPTDSLLPQVDRHPQVAILIDEFDAPVTSMMSDPQAAMANATLLGDFLAVLRDGDVAPLIHFVFVTGVTRFGRPSLDSGPNQLVDISLDPNYAGICGFTLSEFDLLFAERLADTLVKLQKSNDMAPSATIDDLKNKILAWYDGYNWGGETRVLNPFSLLKFFKTATFDSYWTQSAQPSFLSALIRERPQDYLPPRLASSPYSYSYEDLGQSDLAQLQAAPVLFHSGYLTLDKTTSRVVANPLTQKMEKVFSYSFRPPNFEVSFPDIAHLFRIIFGVSLGSELQRLGQTLKKALLDRDAQTIEAIFSALFAALSDYPRPDNEKVFHALTPTLLAGMGFKTKSQLLGSNHRLALSLELADQVLVVLELRSSHHHIKLTPKEKNQILSDFGMKNLTTAEVTKSFAELAARELSPNETARITFQALEENLSPDEISHQMTLIALKWLPNTHIERAIASAAKKKWAKDVIKNVLFEAARALALTEKRVNKILLKTAKKAVRDLIKRDYPSQLKPAPQEIIYLGVATYGQGSRVKATFGPKWRRDL
ncbi:MAG: AAA family ATPase [Deltaproteobacteria bacterium]|jgi:hypothetical protein|nr:AAA family ATPase [Deltaproteobacteria bacterium]